MTTDNFFLWVGIVFALYLVWRLRGFIALWFKIRFLRDKKKDKGWIYAFYDRGQIIPTIKIGLTNDMKHRMRAHRTGAPFGLRILCQFYVPHMNAVENLLHTRYKGLRIRSDGEWFWLMPRIWIELKLLNLFKPFFK